MSGVAEVAAALCELESDLVTAWLKRPEVRAMWPVVPSELYSPHVRLLVEAAQAMPSMPDGDLCAHIMCDGNWRRKLIDAFGSAPKFSLNYVSDVPATLEHAKSLRTALLVQDGVSRALSTLSPTTDVGKLINELRGAIEAGEQATRQKAFSERDMFKLVHEEVSSQDSSGLSTGFQTLTDMGCETTLDRLTGGIREGHIWAFGAPTNWGKSSWLLALADRWMRHHEVPVLYVSCEDAPNILASRLASRRLGIPGKDIRDRRLTQEQRTEIAGLWGSGGTKEWFLDGRGTDVTELATAIRVRIKSDGVKLVLIDYLQCVRSDRHAQDRRMQINHIARTLTEAIKTEGAAGVMASQLTDENLRESRDLEHAAEVVIIGRQVPTQDHSEGERSLWLKKNKTGRKDISFPLIWDDSTASFPNMTSGEEIGADFSWDDPAFG